MTATPEELTQQTVQEACESKPSSPESEHTEEKALSVRSADIICGGVATIIGGIYLYSALQLPYPSCVFPAFCALWIAIIGFCILVKGAWKASKVKKSSCSLPKKKVWIIIASIIMLACAFETIGFFASSFIFLVCISTFVIGKNYSAIEIVKNCVIMAVFLAVLYLVFVIAMEVQLPDTILR